MNEMHAVVGYLPDAIAKAASHGDHKAPLEVRIEQGKDNMLVRIDGGDILGVLLGASNKGETSVQVFVKPKANIDTISRGVVADLVLHPIRDINLFRFGYHPNVIYIDPQLVKKLVAFQSESHT